MTKLLQSNSSIHEKRLKLDENEVKMQSKCVPPRRAQACGSIVHHRYGHLRNLWQPGFFSIEIDR